MGWCLRLASPHMPSVKYSVQAIADLKRLHDFLVDQDPVLAQRAIKVIAEALEKISLMPERFRPVEGKTDHREALISFGRSGYLARFRYLPTGEITIARIKHQKQREFKSQ